MRICQSLHIIVRIFILVTCFAGVAEQLRGSESIELTGEYKLYTYNKHTSAVDPPAQLNVTFSATVGENAWKICATNFDNPNIWSEVMYDGTNTYIFIPYNYHFKNNPRKGSNWVYTTISSGPIYYPSTSDDVALYMPWITYCLPSNVISNDKGNTSEIPLPWYIPRLQLCAYGYKWIVAPSPDDRFAKTIDIIRDTSLDLNDNTELLRWQMDYPDSLTDRGRHVEVLGVRTFIPDNFLVAHYAVSNFYTTNNWTIPQKSECIFYTYSPNHSYPHYKIDLEVRSLKFKPGAQRVDNYTAFPVYVHDYRYKMSNDFRIFKYAEYTLQDGESWKSDKDPVLLKEANNWLKHGRKYNDYGFLNSLYNLSSKDKKVLALLVIVLAQMPFVVVLWLKHKKQTKNYENAKIK